MFSLLDRLDTFYNLKTYRDFCINQVQILKGLIGVYEYHFCIISLALPW
jgi:hypothetical protein